jgi:hypothetical protein
VTESVEQFYRSLADYQQQFPGFVLAPALVQQLAAQDAPALESAAALTDTAAASATLTDALPVTTTLPITPGVTGGDGAP